MSVRIAALSAAIVGATAWGLAVPTEASAQTRDDLTYAEALELAARHNPAYRRALNDMSLSGPLAREAWGAFLPSLQLSTGTRYGFNEQSIGTDDFGNPVENPEVRRLWSSGSDQGFSFRLPIFEGGARFHDRSRARANADANTWAARSALTAAEAEIKRQFFAAQLADELLRLESELLEARQDDLSATERLFEVAARSQSDVLGAELDVQRQARQRDAQAAERAKAMVALRAAIGDPALEVAGLAAETIAPVDPATLDVGALVQLAVSGQPLVHQRRAEIDMANASVSRARSARWPSISLQGGYTRAASGLDQDFLFDLNPDASKYGSLGLSIDLPLFQGFSTSARIAEAEVARDNAAETLRETELNTERDVRQSLIDLETRFRALELSTAERDLAERRLGLVREEYRLAVKGFTELQEAVRAEADARRAEVQARYDYMTALIALEERIGGSVSGSGSE